jgi:hypothetical protein
MLGVRTFIKRFESPLQAEMALMHHYAAKQKALHGWERRYSHLQFVVKWAPVFRKHSLWFPPAQQSPGPLAA